MMTKLTLVHTGLTENDVERLRRRVGESLSENTKRAYQLAWRQWSEFAGDRGLTLFPADPRSLAAFFDQRADTLALNTLLLARTGIAKMHKIANYRNPCADPIVAATIRAIRRVAPSPRQAKPLTQEVLASMAGVLNERDDALLRVMRDGLLRVSEASALKWVHIEFLEDGTGTVFVARSKTDIGGQGHYGHLSSVTIKSLERIGPGHPNEPVFGITADHISRWIRTLTLRAGLGAGYSGHSPRVGMAVDLAESGVDLPGIMQAGRWRDPSVLARYIEQIRANRNAVAQYYAKVEKNSK